MYILIVAMGYPTPKYKGNGIFEFDQAKALAEAGYKVIFAAVDVRSIRRWRRWGFESFRKDGVQIETINIPGGRIPKPILHRMQILGLKQLSRRIEKKYGKPDIIHAHFTSIGHAAAKLKKQVNLPLVITEHSSAINQNTISKQLFSSAAFTYEQADALIAVSQSLSKSILEKFGAQARYIPNIVDTEIFSYIPREKDGQYNFISVGNLIYGKRMDLTIEAFYRAFKELPNVTLTIFGEGIERFKLEKLIEQYKLNNSVTLMGMQPRKMIAEYLSKSDCFVLASKSETFGVAYAEALAVGVPVIATKSGGPEGFVNKDNGILIEVDDIEGLTNAMLDMYNESNSFNREKISKEIVGKFSPKAVACQLINIYNNLLSK